MNYRKLRIAWSVAWGIPCVLLVALWVRSYSMAGSVAREGDVYVLTLGANKGTMYAVRWMNPNGHLRLPSSLGANWKHSSGHVYDFNDHKGMYYLQLSGIQDEVRFPIYLLVVVTVTFAAGPWLPWSPRFSLRALLVLMTLVAVGLGVVVYAVR